jgi:hypothetical protein
MAGLAKEKFEFQGFKTKVGLRKVVRFLLKNYPTGQEFRSSLLSDLVYHRHYWYSAQKKRPVKFKKRAWKSGEYRKADSYSFQAYFPGLGWRELSWNKCVDGSNDIEENISKALREAAEPFVLSYRNHHPICERCETKPAREIDHVDPEFSIIEKEARKLISEEEVTSWATRLMGFERWDFAIPGSHPAIKFIQETHWTAKLMAVCKECHLLNAQERKSKGATHV